MIVCDMCPDRTPATFRMVIESVDPERVKLESDDPYGFQALTQAMGFLRPPSFRNTTALCEDHTKLMASDPLIGRALFEDAVKANRNGGDASA